MKESGGRRLSSCGVPTPKNRPSAGSSLSCATRCGYVVFSESDLSRGARRAVDSVRRSFAKARSVAMNRTSMHARAGQDSARMCVHKNYEASRLLIDHGINLTIRYYR